MIDENFRVAMVYQIAFRGLLIFFTTFVKNVCVQKE
jgi:hypothetical protein